MHHRKVSRMKRWWIILGVLALVAGGYRCVSFSGPANAATPPPSPPPLTAPAPSVSPIAPAGALPTPPPGGAVTVPIASPKASASPSPRPTPPRNGISGVWEVQIQRSDGTTYTHLKLDQNGNVLTGQYLDSNGKRYPVAGSIDKKDVRLVVSLPNGASLIFTGTQDGGTDMIGMLATATDSIPFTASYRPKYNWLENVSPGGGMSGVP